MPRTTIPLPAPPGFDLRSTVRSHGWSDLAPFDTDRTGDTLVLHLAGAKATVTQRDGRTTAVLDSPARLAAADRRRLAATIGSCLRFDLDLNPFWELCRDDPDLAWVPAKGAGRFLRAPTVFGEAMMILATTNCSWALTKRIVSALVECWGVDGALPTRERMARVPERELRRLGRLGYRAPHLAALARGPDLETLRDDGADTDDLRRRLLRLPGFGPYASECMLRALGRFEHFAIDSMVVSRWKARHPRRKPTARAIGRHFQRYGAWRGLALWLTLTEHWHRREEWRI